VLKFDDAEVAEAVASGDLVDGFGADVEQLIGAQSGDAGRHAAVNRCAGGRTRQVDAPTHVNQQRLRPAGLHHLLRVDVRGTAGTHERQVAHDDVQTVLFD